MSQGSINHKLRVYSSIEELIATPDNPTPLVRLKRTNPGQGAEIYLKLERYNPFGSVKDRIALEMLQGLVIEGKTLIEPSSGNTGIALACIANARGIPVEIAVPEKIPEEKKAILRFLGAKVSEADDTLCPLFPSEGARGLVKALTESADTRDTYISSNQYENELNLMAHYKTTGPEIWQQTEGRIEYFLAGLGTCGTIAGVGRYLKEQNPKVNIIGVEPTSSNHKLPGMKRITGLDKDLVPGLLDSKVIDEILEVTDDDAYATVRHLARKEGIPSGPTTGAILWAALKYLRDKRGLAVVLSPDDAFKYASLYNDFWESDTIDDVRLPEYDLSGLLCPASKLEAVRILDSLSGEDTIRIILGDRDSLKSVTQELTNNGLRPRFTKDAKGRFVLTLTKKHE